MGVAQIRGGYPWVWREIVTDTGWAVRSPFNANYLHVETATLGVKVYFQAADFVNDQNYILVSQRSGPTPDIGRVQRNCTRTGGPFGYVRSAGNSGAPRRPPW